MSDFWKWLTDGFMPHGYCLRWDGQLLFVFIAGNLGIAIAYFLIPLALRYFIGKREDLPFPHMFRLFAAFILSCGLTHIAKIWTLYQPAYWIEALLDLWTAGVSLLTAVLLLPLIPRALNLRSPKAMDDANKQLAEANQRLEEANKELLVAGETERLLSLLVHSVQEYAIFMLDPNGNVMTWNEGAERIKGRHPGRSCHDLDPRQGT